MVSVYKTEEWKIFKQLVFKLRGTVCERCGVPDATTTHHIKYRGKGQFAFWNVSNVVVICKSCHHKVHFPEEYEIPHDLELFERSFDYLIAHGFEL
jgi:5-methylcytosine-specific restriction endonuclease McrA